MELGYRHLSSPKQPLLKSSTAPVDLTSGVETHDKVPQGRRIALESGVPRDRVRPTPRVFGRSHRP